MSSRKSYDFQAGLLMTFLIGAAFLIHRQQQPAYLADQTHYSSHQNAGNGASNEGLLLPTAGTGSPAEIKTQPPQH